MKKRKQDKAEATKRKKQKKPPGDDEQPPLQQVKVNPFGRYTNRPAAKKEEFVPVFAENVFVTSQVECDTAPPPKEPDVTPILSPIQPPILPVLSQQEEAPQTGRDDTQEMQDMITKLKEENEMLKKRTLQISRATRPTAGLWELAKSSSPDGCDAGSCTPPIPRHISTLVIPELHDKCGGVEPATASEILRLLAAECSGRVWDIVRQYNDKAARLTPSETPFTASLLLHSSLVFTTEAEPAVLNTYLHIHVLCIAAASACVEATDSILFERDVCPATPKVIAFNPSPDETDIFQDAKPASLDVANVIHSIKIVEEAGADLLPVETLESLCVEYGISLGTREVMTARLAEMTEGSQQTATEQPPCAQPPPVTPPHCARDSSRVQDDVTPLSCAQVPEAPLESPIPCAQVPPVTSPSDASSPMPRGCGLSEVPAMPQTGRLSNATSKPREVPSVSLESQRGRVSDASPKPRNCGSSDAASPMPRWGELTDAVRGPKSASTEPEGQAGRVARLPVETMRKMCKEFGIREGSKTFMTGKLTEIAEAVERAKTASQARRSPEIHENEEAEDKLEAEAEMEEIASPSQRVVPRMNVEVMRKMCREFGIKEGSKAFMTGKLAEIVEAAGKAKESFSQAAQTQVTQLSQCLLSQADGERVVLTQDDRKELRAEKKTARTVEVMQHMYETMTETEGFGVTSYGETDLYTKTLMLEPIDPDVLFTAFNTSNQKVTKAQVNMFMEHHGMAVKKVKKPGRHY